MDSKVLPVFNFIWFYSNAHCSRVYLVLQNRVPKNRVPNNTRCMIKMPDETKTKTKDRDQDPKQDLVLFGLGLDFGILLLVTVLDLFLTLMPSPGLKMCWPTNFDDRILLCRLDLWHFNSGVGLIFLALYFSWHFNSGVGHIFLTLYFLRHFYSGVSHFSC